MRNKSSLSVIFITVFIDLMGFGILIPILPTFASKNLDISDFGIGIIVAAYSFIQFLFNPLLGKISDRIGRRPLILITLFITSISYLVFSISDSFFLLLLSRLIAGFGGSNIGVAQAYIADVTPKEQRSKGMGLIGAAFGLGFVFGPFIGGALSQYGYSVAGYAASVFSFLALIFAFFMLPESKKEASAEENRRTLFFDFNYVKSILTHPSLGLLIIIFFIIIFSIANIYGTFAILTYKVYGLTDMQTGYLFALIGIISAIIQGGLINRITSRFDDRKLVLTGLLFMMTGLGLLPYGMNFIGLALVSVIMTFGTGILQPVVLSMISRYSPEKEQGAILGLNQSLASLARVLGPFWGGIAYNFIGYQFPFLTGAVFTLLTFFISYYFLRKERLQRI